MRHLLSRAMLAMLAVLGCQPSCSSSTAKGAFEQASRSSDPAEQESEIGYARGAWWTEGVGSLMLAGSHIVLSHREIGTQNELIAVERHSRSKSEAIALAWKLSRALQARPEDFESTARSYSDDPITGALGGSLGSFNAMAVPREFVDAFANLREDEVSRPVATAQGIHVLRRDQVLPPSTFDVAEIVIKHAGSLGWSRTDRPAPTRTRDEARTLISNLAKILRSRPSEFDRIARDHSDAQNAVLGGERGTWSTYDTLDFEFMLVAVASRLADTQISEPFELQNGFHIVQRRPASRRPTLAASIISIGHRDSQLSKVSDPAEWPTRSKSESRALAASIQRALSNDPAAFDALRTKFCDSAFCRGVTAWRPGQGPAALEAALATVGAHALTREPVDSAVGFLLARREDAALYRVPSAEPPTFAFPLFGAARQAVANARAEGLGR